MVMNAPGRKNASGVTQPDDSTAACESTVASAISEPASIITSIETRLPIRVEMKLPMKKPAGNSQK